MSKWIMALLLLTCLFVSLAARQNLVRTFTDETGRLIDEYSIPDVPVDQRISGPVATPTRSSVVLTEAPAFDWSYGCAATSAAMLAGYWDRRRFDNLYTGPTNGGVMPLSNSTWGVGECPLSATHNGIDNLSGTGHVDRFWVAYESSGNDPFGTGDPTSLYSSCTADYMGTNQDWWSNGDGSTTIYTYNGSGSPLSNYITPESYTPRKRDIIRGVRLFFESRGYVVSTNFNQKIYGWEGVTSGFTFADYMASIDAGVPVFIHVVGHTMLGVGYDSATSTVYLHDTWDYSLHSMTWGGSYSTMAHWAVSVLTLAPASIANSPSSITQSLATNLTASQNLTISNPGTQTLNYTSAVTMSSVNVLDETFTTTTMPTGWTQVNDNGATPWVFETGGYNSTNPSTAYDGTYNARLFYSDYTLPVTKLITPSLDLTGVSSASLSFWHTQAVWSPDQDELRVYYKTTAAGAWTLLNTYTANITSWTQETIALPNLTGTYYIGFQGTAKYGFGVCLDKVVVTKQNSSSWLTVNGGSNYTGSIAVGGAANAIPIGFNSTGLAVGTYNSSITVTSNSSTNSSYTIPVTLTVTSSTPIVISAPTTGTVWAGGVNQTISWNYSGSGTTVTCSYSTNGGTNWTLIGTLTTVAGTNNYTLASPFVYSTNCKIKLVDSVSPNYTATSNAFTINSPAVTVNQTSIALGTLLINTTTTRTFNISNPGTLTLAGNITTPTGYSVVSARETTVAGLQKSSVTTRDRANTQNRNTLAYSIPAGSNTTYTLTFAPTSVVAYNGNVTITHNAGGTSKTIALTGQGGKSTIGKSATSFTANLAPGQTNSQTLTISNTGNMALNYGLTISGTVAWLKINAGTTLSNTIAVSGAAQNVTVACNSAGMAPGTYNATINGTSNDPGSLTYSITVTLTVRIPTTISAPAGGDFFASGTSQIITWNYTGAGTTVTLYYSINGGSTWVSGGALTSAQGTNNYSWTVPAVSSTNCKIRLVDSVSPNYVAISNVFTISAAPSIPANIAIAVVPNTLNLIITWSASTGSPVGYKIYSCSSRFFASDVVLLNTVPATQTSLVIPAASTTAQTFYRVVSYK